MSKIRQPDTGLELSLLSKKLRALEDTLVGKGKACDLMLLSNLIHQVLKGNAQSVAEIPRPEALAALTYNDPLLFAEACIDWDAVPGVGEDAGPDQWQADFLETIRQEIDARREGKKKGAIRVAVKSGHGPGKGTLVAWLVLWWLTTRQDSRGIITANTQSQLLGRTWPEIAKWRGYCVLKDWVAWKATRIENVMRPATWKVDAIPWSITRPEAFAGTHARHVMVIFDEASAIPDEIWEVAEGSLTTDECIFIAFGNPTRHTGKFRQCFIEDNWLNMTVDCRYAKMTNKDQINEWIQRYGLDSDFVRVRVLGEFPAHPEGQFIPWPLVEEASRRDAAPLATAMIYLGLDVARGGGSKTVLVGRTGNSIRFMRTWNVSDLMHVVSLVAEELNRVPEENYGGLAIDATGVGAGVYDRLKELKFPSLIPVFTGGKADDPERYANKRAQLWDKMREWLRTAILPKDSELIEQLTSITASYDNRGRLIMQKKDTMIAQGLPSPDKADALALTFAVTPCIYDARGRPIRRGGYINTVVEYDVLG